MRSSISKKIIASFAALTLGLAFAASFNPASAEDATTTSGKSSNGKSSPPTDNPNPTLPLASDNNDVGSIPAVPIMPVGKDKVDCHLLPHHAGDNCP